MPDRLNFEQFYIKKVLPYWELNPTYIRPDGLTSGKTLDVFGYFYYDDVKWVVYADSEFEMLKFAYKRLQSGLEPFEKKPTRKNKNICLEIKGEHFKFKNLYIYKA